MDQPLSNLVGGPLFPFEEDRFLVASAVWAHTYDILCIKNGNGKARIEKKEEAE